MSGNIIRKNLYFNLDNPTHQKAYSIYMSVNKCKKADLVCEALIAYQAPSELEERIDELVEKVVNEKVEDYLKRLPALTMAGRSNRIDNILGMHQDLLKRK